MPICTVGSSLTARKAGHRAEVAAVSAPNVRCARAHRRFLLEKGTVGFFLRGIASQNAGAHRRIVVLRRKKARSGLSGRESRPESTIRPCRSAFSARNGQPKAADGERLHFWECGGSCERRWPFGHLAFGWAGCGGAAIFSAGSNERGPDDEWSTGPLLRGEARGAPARVRSRPLALAFDGPMAPRGRCVPQAKGVGPAPSRRAATDTSTTSRSSCWVWTPSLA